MSKKINLTDIDSAFNSKKEEKIDLSKIGGISKEKSNKPMEQEEKRKEYCITIKPSIYEKFKEIARKEQRRGNISRANLYIEKKIDEIVKAYETINGKIDL